MRAALAIVLAASLSACSFAFNYTPRGKQPERCPIVSPIADSIGLALFGGGGIAIIVDSRRNPGPGSGQGTAFGATLAVIALPYLASTVYGWTQRVRCTRAHAAAAATSPASGAAPASP